MESFCRFEMQREKLQAVDALNRCYVSMCICTYSIYVLIYYIFPTDILPDGRSLIANVTQNRKCVEKATVLVYNELLRDIKKLS